MIKFMVISLGSGLPSYLVWNAAKSQGLMIQFWGALAAFSIGWYLSRRFARDHLDL